MGKSYKKVPRQGDSKGSHKKKIASKITRQWLKQHPEDTKNYKKIYLSWNICDYEMIIPWEKYWQQVLDDWYVYGQYHNQDFPNQQTCYQEWKKYFKRK